MGLDWTCNEKPQRQMDTERDFIVPKRQKKEKREATQKMGG